MSYLRRTSRLTNRPLTLALVGLAGVSVASVACQHSDAAKKVRADAIEDAKSASPLIPVDRTQGMDPTEALTPKVIPITEDSSRSSCGDTLVKDLYVPNPAVEEEAAGIVAAMDIDQKVVQLVGIDPPPAPYPAGSWDDIQRSEDDPKAGIRGYLWRDGPHGLNLESGLNRDPLEKADGTGNNATSFPTSVLQGATFDFELVRRVGEAMADETVAFENTVLLGPCMNVLRNPLWGRSQETFGEDTFHLGRIGTALTVGIQEHIAACAKHYIANNIEQDRFSISSDMDEQTLREIYGRHFEMVVRDGGVACMMASYNSINGKKQTQNKHTLTTMLREDMGFEGFVLTDWWAMPGANEGQGPIDAPQDLVTAKEALEAGLDVEVPWSLNFDAIPQLVADGAMNVSYVDTAVKRVIEQKLRFKSAYMGQPVGLSTPDTGYDAVTGNITNTQGHAELARESAEEGIVLLKNDGVLPIKDATTIAVLGATVEYTLRSEAGTLSFNFATDAALGDRGSSRVRAHPSLTVGPFDGIKAAAPEGVNVVVGSTAEDARDADFVVVVVGLTAGDEGEEYTGASDRESLALPNVHNALVTAAAALNKPMVVVVESGGAVDMPWLSQAEAVVMAWYPGQQGGAALGRLLFGQTNFSGKLPITWPQSLDQFPTFNEGPSTRMDYYVGYKYFDVNGLTPLYAFGHGLSYSTFEYQRIHIPCAEVSNYGLIQVEVDVANTSGVAGKETVMVFASYPETERRRSKKELKGFAKISLEPGETKRVSIPIRIEDLKVWNSETGAWAIEIGPVEFHVGPSFDKLTLSQTVEVTGPAGD